MRGEWIDLGGRRLRFVKAGPWTTTEGADPLVLLECGAFGCAADWYEVQQGLARIGLRSLAYDRAGLGLSDPGPEPRDGHAIVADLQALLQDLDEVSPLILTGHSMAGLFLRILAPRLRQRLLGMVLVDAVTPEAVDHPVAARWIGGFRRAMILLDRVAGLGVMGPWSLVAGDRIGLPADISREKRRIYASTSHARASAREVQQWLATAEQGRRAGPHDPDLPVAVVTAGASRLPPDLRALQDAPARTSRSGYADRVPGADHANLLGPHHAHRVIQGVRHILDVSRV